MAKRKFIAVEFHDNKRERLILDFLHRRKEEFGIPFSETIREALLLLMQKEQEAKEGKNE